MINAKDELLEVVGSLTIKCATINIDNRSRTNAILPIGYTTEEFEAFLNTIDIDYDGGYGSQELDGNIWFTNGMWAERAEYDGSEWWYIPRIPDIPNELNK